MAIVGTGSFGRALGSLATARGVKYVFGSRAAADKEAWDSVTGAQILPIEEAVRKSRIVILAVPPAMAHTLPLQEFRYDKPKSRKISFSLFS